MKGCQLAELIARTAPTMNSNTTETFTKTIKKRVDSEVFEVYRHGIVHGSVVNFDNIVVATKAWNMLFAV